MSVDYYLMRRAPAANNSAASKTKGIYRFFIGLLGYWLIALPVYAAVERVISLAPSTTELAYAAGLGEKLVAASDFSDYPAAANKLERVASWQGINVERILALKPDLILAWRGGNPQRPLDQLAALGIPIFYSDARSFEQIAQELEKLTAYSPHPDRARQAAAHIRQRSAELYRQYGHQSVHRSSPLRILIQLGTQPLFTSSADTLQNEIIFLCGGENIFADSRVPWPQISREQVLRRQPQLIVITGQSAAHVKNFWLPQLKLPVITLNEDWFNRAGPRSLLAAEQLCSQLATFLAQ